MKRLYALIIAATLCFPSIGALAFWHSIQQKGVSAGGGCTPGTHAAAFLARTSGLSGTETTAYCNLINGLDTDSTFALLDALYIFATNTTSTANLNLVSTSFGITQSGAVTFSADNGYTGDGSTGFLNTNLTPPATHYTQNSASFGCYILTNRGADAGSVSIGAGASVYAFMQPFVFGSNVFGYDINAAAFPSVANTSTNNAWIVTRPSSGTENVYKNGSTTPFTTATVTSTGVPATTFTFLALAGTSDFDQFDQIAAGFIGGGLTGTQAAAINNRINAYMTALGINVY